MSNYLITAEDADGKYHMQRIEAESEEEAKYIFWRIAPRSKYIRIVSVALTSQEFKTQDENAQDWGIIKIF